MKRYVKKKVIWGILIIEVLILAILSNGKFISPNNIINICRQIAYYGIAAVGMTFVILTGGIDLSIGSIVSLVNMVCAFMMVNLNVNIWLAVLISLIIAIIIGYINGTMISYAGIPPLIATFAAQIVFAGIAFLITNGKPISGFIKIFPEMNVFARGMIGPIPVCAVIMVICFIIGSIILNRTYFGRYFYAIGSNAYALKLAGVNVKKVKTLVYSLSGFFAGLAGIIILSRAGSAQANVGAGFEFDVITCVVLGGVSVSGGVGSISGVLAGVLIIGSLTNGMILMDISAYTQMVVKGVVLALAVGIDYFLAVKKEKDNNVNF